MAVEVDFQAAIYTRLTAQLVGAGKPTTGVHDVKPQSDPAGGFPYVTIGQTMFTMDDAQGSFNFQALARIHTWSRSGGTLETKQIQGAIYDALHNHTLAMPRLNGAGAVDWLCYSLLREASRIEPDPDQSFHGVCEYRALIQAA